MFAYGIGTIAVRGIEPSSTGYKFSWEKEKTKIIKVGDRVKYVSNKYEEDRNNPTWGGKYGKIPGTVIKDFNTDGWCRVKFDNGGENAYQLDDLELLVETPAVIKINNNYSPDEKEISGGKEKMSVIKNLFKSKERKALEKYNIVNGDGGLTCSGREELIDFLYERDVELKKAFVAKIIEAYDEENKK